MTVKIRPTSGNEESIIIDGVDLKRTARNVLRQMESIKVSGAEPVDTLPGAMTLIAKALGFPSLHACMQSSKGSGAVVAKTSPTNDAADPTGDIVRDDWSPRVQRAKWNETIMQLSTLQIQTNMMIASESKLRREQFLYGLGLRAMNNWSGFIWLDTGHEIAISMHKESLKGRIADFGGKIELLDLRDDDLLTLDEARISGVFVDVFHRRLSLVVLIPKAPEHAKENLMAIRVNSVMMESLNAASAQYNGTRLSPYLCLIDDSRRAVCKDAILIPARMRVQGFSYAFADKYMIHDERSGANSGGLMSANANTVVHIDPNGECSITSPACYDDLASTLRKIDSAL